MGLKILKTAMVGAALVASLSIANNASATTVTSDLTCQLTDVSGGGSNADDCFGASTGNNSLFTSAFFETSTFIGYYGDADTIAAPGPASDADTTVTTGLFGNDDWNEVAKWEVGSSFNLDVDTSADPDTWTILNDAVNGYSYMAVILKQASEYAAYLFDPTEVGGTFFTSFANDAGGISNVTIWAGNEDGCVPTVDNNFCGPPTSVPLPAGLPLMLSVLGIGAYLRSRSRKTA